MNLRIQIAVYDKLVAEAIVENRLEADALWSKWTNSQYDRKQPLGCAIVTRSDIRTWEVPVGGIIN